MPALPQAARSASPSACAEMPEPQQMQDWGGSGRRGIPLLPVCRDVNQGNRRLGLRSCHSVTRLARFGDRPAGKPKSPGDCFCLGPSRSDRAASVDIHADLEVVGVAVSPEHAELLDVGLSVERV